MSQENKSNNLKRGYPVGNENDRVEQETREVITDVISILRIQEQQNNGFVQPLIKGAVPPPNTPCSKD